MTYQPAPTVKPEPRPPTTIEICEQIAQDYYQSHKYIPGDVFDCDNMSEDVWNMLIAKGINARIAVGNVQKADSVATEYNHAWVMAETTPGKWLAIETTGGYVVYKADNPLYYQGWRFDNPKELRDFYQLWSQLLMQLARYEAAVQYYNALIDEYNSSGMIERLLLLPKVNQAADQVKEEGALLEELMDEITALVDAM